MIVGLTGGIATGKSTVTAMLQALGAYVVDADVWARRVVEPGSPGLAAIAAHFGADILEADGALSRAKLATIIFSDAAARQTLNQITHPLVREGMRAETAAFFATHPTEPIVWDVPLLFEGEIQHLVDESIVVVVDDSIQLQRLMARNNLSQEDAQQRIVAQLPLAKKAAMATYVVDNNQSLDNTKRQVRQIWQEICAKMHRRGRSR